MPVSPLGAKQEATGLLEAWLADLGATAQRGEPAAYSFVMGSCAELLSALDIPMFLPELKCIRSAALGTAQGLLDHAEEQGYSPDICNYLKADIGMHLEGGVIKERLLPAPSLAIATTACNTYIKWAEIWERLYDMPLFVFDIPGSRDPAGPSRPGDRGYADDLGYVEAQLRALISLCQDITGRRLDRSRLAQSLQYTAEMSRDFRRMLEMNRTGPDCFDALREGAAYLGVFNAYRGTEAGARFFSRAAEELARAGKERPRQPDEHRPYRLLFAGIPCYPIYGEFMRMFSRHGGVFVAANYLHFASGGGAREVPFDPARPVEGLAENLLVTTREAMDSMFLTGDRLPELLAAYQADGVVFHSVKSCRTSSSGLTDARLSLLSRCSVPTLLIESDMMDRRLISAAQLRNRIDAFFETLSLRRRAGAS